MLYLCDFHREQAWERWVKDGSHGLNSAEQDWLLNQLRAWAPLANPEESLPSDHHNQEDVATLQSSDLWESTSLHMADEYMVKYAKGEGGLITWLFMNNR